MSRFLAIFALVFYSLCHPSSELVSERSSETSGQLMLPDRIPIRTGRALVACDGDGFSCDDGKRCLSRSEVCDGTVNCNDGKDEESTLCGRLDEEPCESDGFRCPESNECIHRDLLCDGKKDCSDGSDEDDWCYACESFNGGCERLCVPELDGPRCECPPTMVLLGDGKTCWDFDECKAGTSGCEHYCANVVVRGLSQRGFECSCKTGYALEADGKSCRRSGSSKSSTPTMVLIASVLCLIIVYNHV